MKKPTLFKEYIWLVETIQQAGRITFSRNQQEVGQNGDEWWCGFTNQKCKSG